MVCNRLPDTANAPPAKIPIIARGNRKKNVPYDVPGHPLVERWLLI